MDPLRFSQFSTDAQIDILLSFVRETDWMMETLRSLCAMELPDSWLVAGAIYNLVWNKLTGRPADYGIKDIDIAYFDDSDISWDAEDRVIQTGHKVFAGSIKPIEIRNQARVHLWFPKHFGFEIDPLKSSRDSIARYSAKVHCVAARLDAQDKIELYAPFGLGDLFSLKFKPNYAFNQNRQTYAAKAERAKAMWPELEIYQWGQDLRP